MPRSCSSRIQSDIAWRLALRPFTVPAGVGNDRDDAPRGLAVDHLGNDGRGTIDDAKEVDADVVLPDLRSGFPKRLAQFGRRIRAGVPGVIDEDADWSERRVGPRYHLLDPLMIGNVRL
jgi:hypothetical protein